MASLIPLQGGDAPEQEMGLGMEVVKAMRKREPFSLLSLSFCLEEWKEKERGPFFFCDRTGMAWQKRGDVLRGPKREDVSL